MKSENLMNLISEIPDPRVTARSKYPLEEILAIACCAVICGAESWIDVVDWAYGKRQWLKNFLKLENGIPSHDTFGRVFSILNSEYLQKMFMEWVKTFTPAENFDESNIINIDGKYLKGSYVKKKNEKKETVSLISAWSSSWGLVLAAEESRFEKDKGEKKIFESVLDKLYLKGAIVTLDASGATTTITEKVVAGKGDYIIGLKDNQRKLKKLCRFLFDNIENGDLIETFETSEKGHGRIEKRRYDFLKLKGCHSSGFETLLKIQEEKWETLKGFCRVRSSRIVKGVERLEERYFFTSLDKNVEEIGKAIRSHWEVENKVHWVMDVVFREDASKVRMKHASANLGIIRRMALNLLKQENSQDISMRRKRKLCGWEINYLEKVLWG